MGESLQLRDTAAIFILPSREASCIFVRSLRQRHSLSLRQLGSFPPFNGNRGELRPQDSLLGENPWTRPSTGKSSLRRSAGRSANLFPHLFLVSLSTEMEMNAVIIDAENHFDRVYDYFNDWLIAIAIILLFSHKSHVQLIEHSCQSHLLEQSFFLFSS